MTAEELAAVGLRYDEQGAVATITLDRPEVYNAQTPAMWRGLARLGEEIPESVRVVVVTGAGGNFSAGLDRSMLDPRGAGEGTESVIAMLGRSDEEMSGIIDEYQRGFTFLRDPRFISIAAVRGHAIGAGFQLALSCDLRLVADDVRFCMKETALGLVPDLTGTKPLVEAVGYSRALDLCATARVVGAEEAVRIGLALDAVAPDRLDQAVADLTASLNAHTPGAVLATKQLLQGAADRSLDEQRRLEREAQVVRMREVAAMLGG